MDPAAFSRLSLAQTSQQTKAPLPSACTREEDEVVFKPRRSRQSRNGEQGATRVQAPTCRTDSETLGNAATAQTKPLPQSGENKNVTPRGRTPKSKAVYESDILTSTRQSVSLSKKAMKQLEGSPKVNTYLTHKSNHTHPCTIVPAYGPLNVSPLGGASLTSKPPHNAFIPYQTSRFTSTISRQQLTPTQQHLVSQNSAKWAGSTTPHSGHKNKSIATQPYGSSHLILNGSSLPLRPLTKQKMNGKKVPPQPSHEYVAQASIAPTLLPSPQRLLIVLDLNGTLLERSSGMTIHERPWLQPFLSYCLTNHSVLVWSSAQRKNVNRMCEFIFRDKNKREMLVADWSRETLVDFNSRDFGKKIKVYKLLNDIWENPDIQARNPDKDIAPWSQANTILVDDSEFKAQAQPWNQVLIPTYSEKWRHHENRREALGQVLAYIEEASKWSDVSAFMKTRAFVADREWAWDWENEKSLVKNA